MYAVAICDTSADVLAERPDVDDRVARVVVDVDDRIEVDDDAEGAAFFGGELAGAIREIGIARGADRHRARQPRGAVQHVADAALEVGRRQQRDLRVALQPVEHRRGRVRIAFARRAAAAVGRVQHQRGKRLGAAEDVDAADFHVADQVLQLLEIFAVGAGEARVQRGDEELADLLVERHLAERLLDPARRRAPGAIDRRLGLLRPHADRRRGQGDE